MKPDWWPGEQHELFTEWAISQGIIANGVAPARFPGRGLGVIATRNIKEGETILTVPLKAMFTINCIPSSFRSKFPEGTPVHTLLAAFFTNGNPEDLEKYSLWRKTWPSRQDFEDSMPILWPEHLRISNPALLPPSVSGSWDSFRKQKSEYSYESFHQDLLAQQEKRSRIAWENVVDVFPGTDWEAFSYHWLVVNTRSFFYLMPEEEQPADRNDAMALLPFADYFNHSDVVDDVQFDGEQYVFRTTKSYGTWPYPFLEFPMVDAVIQTDEGDEIYMSYGPHPNDFIFAECALASYDPFTLSSSHGSHGKDGFFLDENEYEALYLDDIIFRDLGPSAQEELNLQQYYGNYQITISGACFRTEIAACMKYMTRRDWRNYVLGHSTKGADAKKSESIIREWIKTYAKEADTTIATLEAMKSNQAVQIHAGKFEMLLKRWKQISGLCEQALEAVSC